MLVSEVLVRAQRIFGDEAGVQLTEQDVIRWVNDAQREIIVQTEDLLQASSLANTVANQQDYSLPTDLATLRSVHYKIPGTQSFVRLKSLSMQEFDEYADGWEGTQFTATSPIVYHVYANTIRLFPIPASGGTGTLKIYYARKAANVTLTSDTLDLPETYFNAVVAYVLARAYEMDEDWGAASNMNAQIAADVRRNQERHNKTAVETYPTISPRAEDM